MTGRAGATVVVAVLALAAAAGLAPVSLARFTSSKPATSTLGTATLAAPASVAGVNGTTATLNWTASTSTRASGYSLFRSATSGSGFGLVKSVTPVTAVTTTDSPANGTWYYVLQTVYLGWSSPSSNQAMVIVGTPVTTTSHGCAPGSNAPETVASGNGDGYEQTPDSACALDGATAKDGNDGTTAATTCTDAGKDRHKFWGYAFGLPGSVTSINGITVAASLSVSNNGGTTALCAEVSGDGGVTWSTPKPLPVLSTGLATYTFGGATDDWGHGPWSPSQLGTSTFRIRITDVSSNNNKVFRLDYLGAQVTYVP